MWARRWAHGENIGVVGVLEPGPGRAAANKPVLAHSNQQVLQTLTAVLSGVDPEAEVDPQFGHLFPPGTPPPSSLVYQQGSPKARMTTAVEDTATTNRHVAYAGAGGDMTDAEGDMLFPPRTEAEAEEQRRRVTAMARATEPYSDDELHRAIWGEG
jgi:hypothetical protein